MSNEAKFVDGLRVYAPRENAPSFIKANLVINVSELQAWLANRSGEIRIDIKESKSGKFYASENDYKRETSTNQARPKPVDSGDFVDDDPSSIPFYAERQT